MIDDFTLEFKLYGFTFRYRVKDYFGFAILKISFFNSLTLRIIHGMSKRGYKLLSVDHSSMYFSKN